MPVRDGKIAAVAPRVVMQGVRGASVLFHNPVRHIDAKTRRVDRFTRQPVRPGVFPNIRMTLRRRMPLHWSRGEAEGVSS